MPQEMTLPTDGLIPAEPLPAGAESFNDRLHGLMDGQAKDEATVNKALAGMDEFFDQIAARLYNLASMLVGAGEASVHLIELAVAKTEVSAGQDPLEARQSSRRALCAEAIRTQAAHDLSSFSAPEEVAFAPTCIEDNDLDAAAAAGEEFERLTAGPDRDRVRQWLASLTVVTRTVFAMRAVAGLSTAETAALLAANGGPQAAGWNAAAVSEIFRQGLCSLANQLIHSAVTQ